MARAFRTPARIYLRFALYLGACWTIVGVLVNGLFPHAAVVVVAAALYTTFPLALVLGWGGFPFYPGRAFRLFVIRPCLYVQPMLLLVAAFGLVGLLVGAAFAHALDGARALGGSVAAAMALLYSVGYAGARGLVVRELEASHPTLAPAFDGVTIAQITDLHVGPHLSRRHLQRVADTVRSLSADIIAVTGDLVDDRHEDVALYLSVFGSLSAPLGTFVVPGNHDVYAGWDVVRRALEHDARGRLLVNESVTLRRGAATLTIVGTGDPAGGRTGSSGVAPDVDRALGGVPRTATVIALAHNPALWPALVERGVALTLSGHTHWGQLTVPALGWSLASPFLDLAMGPYTRGDALLYIAPGTGYWGIPFRIGASHEVTFVRLKRGPAAIRLVGVRTADGRGQRE